MKRKKSTPAKKTSVSWSCYWAKKSDGKNGCLPEAPSAVSQLLERKWNSFFDSLGQETKVLDLGTGRGAVLKRARIFRPDLQLTGVDYAEVLPPCEAGIEVLPNVKIEELPFSDKSFGAVCSQFGIEYAAFPAGLEEMKRVLEANGQFMLICHCAESIIVQQNASRIALLREIVSTNGLLREALKLKRCGKIQKEFGRQRITQKLGNVHAKYPDQTDVIDKVSSDIVDVMRRRDGIHGLMELQQGIEMEVLRIQALIAAAWNIEQAQTVVRLLSSSGRKDPKCELIWVPGMNVPLAWMIYSGN